jgi:hypothetical protein
MLLGTLTVIWLVGALAHQKLPFSVGPSTYKWRCPTSQIEEKATGAVEKGQAGVEKVRR